MNIEETINYLLRPNLERKSKNKNRVCGKCSMDEKDGAVFSIKYDGYCDRCRKIMNKNKYSYLKVQRKYANKKQHIDEW